MITGHNLSHRIGERQILKKISFSCSTNRITLLGPNGAGKTTLLKILAGLYPAKGDTLWDGQPLPSLSLKDKAKMASFLPQSPPNTLGLSVWEVMLLSRYPHTHFFKEISQREVGLGEQLLSQFKLTSLKHSPLDHLSGGERQKVHLACALFQEPKFLFLDEPLSFLDADAQEEVCAFLKTWGPSHKAQIFMVSQHINMALLWSDEILFLHQGRLVFQGSPQALSISGLIDNIYKGSLKAILENEKTFFLPQIRENP